mgnify:FL=1
MQKLKWIFGYPLSEEVGGTRLLYYALSVRLSRTENRKKIKRNRKQPVSKQGF